MNGSDNENLMADDDMKKDFGDICLRWDSNNNDKKF